MDSMAAILKGFTGLTALTLMYVAASTIVVATNHSVARSARNAFLATLVAIFFIALIDWINYAPARGVPEMRLFHVVSTSLSFAVAPILPVIIANTIFPERYARWVFLVLGVHFVFELANIFVPLTFMVDANNIYARGPAYLVYMSSYCISSVYLVVESIKSSRVYQGASTVAVVAILVCMMGGVAIQVAMPSVRTSWPAVAMAVTLYFQYYSEMVLRSDALTMLLNRHAYKEFLERPTLPCMVVLLDVDSFKRVNDQYGHEYGDVALRTLAQIVRRTFGSVGRCYRSGGDEYVVVLTRQFDAIDSLVSQIYESIAKAQESDPQLPSMSCGYAVATSDGCDDIHAVIEEADKNMYAAKRDRKRVDRQGST